MKSEHKKKENTGAGLSMEMKNSLYEIKCFLIDYHEKNSELYHTKKSTNVQTSRTIAEMLQEEKDKKRHFEVIMSNFSSMFEKIGINPRLQGARFLALCVCFSCANPEYGIMKIYDMVAKALDTDANRVGRACRYACKTADLSRLPETPYFDKGIMLDFNETPTAKQVVYAFAMLVNDKFDFRKIV